MKQYRIIEQNEKKGTIEGESFSSLKKAINRLEVFKYTSSRHGRILKEAVKSFTWEFLDEYNTTWKATYKIVKEG